MEELPVSISLPETMPIMALSGATQFPRALMPLFIFEQRYRDMLDYVLQGDRMFGLANVPASVDSEASNNPVNPIFTAGLVRACVRHDDGTSHLMLMGLQRVEIIGWSQVFPFRVANIIPVENLVIDAAEEQELTYELLALCQHVYECNPETTMTDSMRNVLEVLTDPVVVVDMVGHNFVTDPFNRQELLEIVPVRDRLTYLISHLNAMI